MDPELLEQAAQRWDSLVANGITGDEAKRQIDQWLDSQSVAPGGPSGVESFGRGVAQGVTFEFGDELAAGFRSIPALWPGGETPGESYTREVAISRDRNTAAREAHPWAYGTGSVGGALMTTAVGAGAVGMLTRGAAKVAAPTMAKVAGLGAAEGALVGTGAAEGNLWERRGSAATGAAIGGVLAPAMVAGGRALVGSGRRALDYTGIRPTGEGTGVTQALARRAGIRTKAQRVDDRLASRLGSDADVAGQVSKIEASTTGELTIMDSNPRLQGTARAARGFEGPAKTDIPEFLQNRVQGQEHRILGDALDLSGVGSRTNRFEAIDDMVARRSQAADQAYQPINDVIVENPEILAFLQRPKWQEAYARASADALEAGEAALPALESLTGGVPVRVLNRVKMALDDVLSVGRRQGNLAKSEMRTIREAKNEFLDLMDEEVAGYAGARSDYAGESAILESYEQGLDLFKTHPDEVEVLVRKLGDSEREGYVKGGIEALADRIGNVGARRRATNVRPLSGAPNDERRLRLLFPDDEAFDLFKRGIAEEVTMAQTQGSVTGGSNTAEKLMEMFELSDMGIGSIAQNPIGAAMRGVSNVVRRADQKLSGEIAEGMIEPLTARGTEAAKTLRRLQGARGSADQWSAARSYATAAGTAAVAGPVPSRDANAYRRRMAERRTDQLIDEGMGMAEIQAILRSEGLLSGSR